MENISNEELLKEIQRRGLFTNGKSNFLIMSGQSNFDNVKVILSKGIPECDMECRECRKLLPPESFNYYQSRVDQNGYLMRSNALCNDCGIKSNKERNKVLTSESYKIPEKPKKGSTCPNCNRQWSGNWHRHHVGDKFLNWLCGHCNMSFSDQRIK
jgi:RNase P subunit RPR2